MMRTYLIRWSLKIGHKKSPKKVWKKVVKKSQKNKKINKHSKNDLKKCQAGHRLPCPVQTGKCGRLSTCRRHPVHIRARGPTHRHVPLQVQAHEADPHVQGPEAPGLLPLQHRSGRQGARLRLLDARLAHLALFPQGYVR